MAGETTPPKMASLEDLEARLAAAQALIKRQRDYIRTLYTSRHKPKAKPARSISK